MHPLSARLDPAVSYQATAARSDAPPHRLHSASAARALRRPEGAGPVTGAPHAGAHRALATSPAKMNSTGKRSSQVRRGQ